MSSRHETKEYEHMSHFSVAVISKSPDDVRRLMAPYQENNMGDCPKEYLQFNDVTDEYRNDYESGSATRVKMPDGRLLSEWDDEFRIDGELGYGSSTHSAPENLERVEVPYKELYPTLDDFIQEYAGYHRDPETGKYGYWENPNRKWDYWRVGGRWRGFINANTGTLGPLSWEHTLNGEEHLDQPCFFDSAQLKDCNFSIDPAIYNHALRFWEINVEGKPLEEGEKSKDFFCHWSPQYYTERYPNKEAYAKHKASFSTWALVTPDGKWYEQGSMGFWACNDASQESILTYTDFFEKTLKETDPEYYITILDCHI